MRFLVPLIASLLIVPAAHARSGSHGSTHHSDITVTKSIDKASAKMMSRDSASGQPTGKRMHKPYTVTTRSTLRGNTSNNRKGGRYLAAAKKLPGKRKPPTLTLKRGKHE